MVGQTLVCPSRELWTDRLRSVPLLRGADIESGRNTPQKWDRPRLLPRHIRTALPLLPSGPGGVHEFVIARSPEPDIQISNSRFEIRDQKRRERDSNPHRPFGPPRFQRGAIPIRRSLQKSDVETRGQGEGGEGEKILLVSPSPCPLVFLIWRRGWDSNPRYT